MAIVMQKACNKAYICDIVDTIPREVMERIQIAHPKMELAQIAEFYLQFGDSIAAEIIAEEEYDMFLASLKYEESW